MMNVTKIPARTIERLKAVARSASDHAYCPYSKFRVGAAVLSGKGDIFAGCNVENASYGLTICAERNATFQMVAKAQTVIRVLVIYTPTPTPTAPCGACRQVINEFGPEAEIISCCDGSQALHMRLPISCPALSAPPIWSNQPALPTRANSILLDLWYHCNYRYIHICMSERMVISDDAGW